MALRSKDMQSSATAALGKAAARGPGSIAATYTASGARAPSAAAAQSSKPSYSSRLAATGPSQTPSAADQSSRPSYSSRLAPSGPSQNPSYQNSSRQSNILQPTIDENSASVYTSRGTKTQADRYRPYYALPERNLYPTNRSQRSYSGNETSGEHGQRLPRSVYKPGLIVRAVVHEQDFRGASNNSTVTMLDDKNTTDSRFGKIHTKVRHMIVVACYTSHYLAIPLFTHNGRGLAGKNPAEYISFLDYRSNDKFEPLSEHGVLKTEYLTSGTYPFHPKSTAHFTYPLSRKYDLPVTNEGTLERRSTKLLVNLFTQFAPKGESI